jgi:hypothetical protein
MPLKGLLVPERGAQIERLRQAGGLVREILQVYLAAYREEIEYGMTSGSLEMPQLHECVGEMRLIRTLEKDLSLDLAVVFPDLSLAKGKSS